ncbi:CBS domain-containing protein [Spongiibacter sp. KMU-166]|uniref:CBS domain-containing protein n=1 Tax=Spongiibacter thalassae TaxID=2721624 RepID=A0ABX1GGK2_9GAMM|nr:CBS domain-containing protein [Spongiibacter thalassae]NKI18329.1 CBS domain-containing protein [Spongiibacter thalassae]
MRIGELMSHPPVTIGPDDRLLVVREIFHHTGFHHLLVVEEKQLVGVVSDRDLLRAISPTLGTPIEHARDLATLNKYVHQIMSRKLVVLGPDDDMQQAVAIFNQQPISCIPVVDSNHHPLGILSWRDIMRWLGSLKEAPTAIPPSR